jgi:UDP-GlcNAc:undecaprenyl-phosphate GlcNAc-1-phosphate transferase
VPYQVVNALIDLLALGAVSFASCDLLLRRLLPTARRRGWLVVPGKRHVHERSVPQLGGVAITVAVALSCGGLVVVTGQARVSGSAWPGWPMWTWGGVALLLAAGLLDDRRGLSPTAKLAAQGVAAALAAAGGATVHGVAVTAGGAVLELPPAVGMAIMGLWLVTCTNALNLADGIDGLAGSVGLVALAASVAMAWQHGGSGSLGPVVLAVPLGAALLAFLRHNWTPARVFLGDAGAMPLGFLLGLLLVPGWAEGRGVAYPVAAMAALAYPLADTALAIVRRWRAGLPITQGDRRHIHHQLQERGSAGAATAWIAGAAIVAAVVGVWTMGPGVPRV